MELDLKQIKMKNKFTLFWAGPFSQWEYSPFVIGEVSYNCCEQYMMAQKALLFKDEEIYKQIMVTDSPNEQKALGRRIKGFDKDKWEAVCKQIVYEGNYAKFTQNDNLLKALMATKGTELVEASPEDKIWGIGLHETDPRARVRSKWLGTNWLGEILTRVREDLMTGKFVY